MVISGLNGSHPELAAQRHPTKNGDLAPEQVVDGSHMKVWWICPEGPDYEWEPVIYRRIIGTSCPYCNRGATFDISPLRMSRFRDAEPAQLRLQVVGVE